MTALLDGIYDGEMTISELLGKGNFGLGTFDGLDGEMIILDGTCYQLRGDGSAQIADLDQRTPYAVATNFVPRITADAPRACAAISSPRSSISSSLPLTTCTRCASWARSRR